MGRLNKITEEEKEGLLGHETFEEHCDRILLSSARRQHDNSMEEHE